MKVAKWGVVVLGGLVALGAVLYLTGLFLPVAHVASSSVRLQQPVDSVWRTVRALEESASWWPAVSAMERLPDRDGREVWLQRQTTGDLPMEVMESTAPVRLVMRIADDNLPFGGTWTYEIQEAMGGSRITITEEGEIYNPFFRVMSRFFFGYHGTQESYLTALSERFGETPTIERVR